MVLKCFLVLTIGLVAFKGVHRLALHKKSHNTKKVASPLIEKPFVILIPSYNNSAYCERNLRSVLEQNYDNYRIIYIDDCSKDDTYEKVRQILQNSPQKSPITLIRNEKNQGALYNLYQAIQECEDHEIIVTVDGDDFLAHDGVLKKLNQMYANPDVWMTYGNFLDYPTYSQKPVICKKIPKKVIQKNSYRKEAWVSSHLRTFYAGLFKAIKLEDLLYQGRFLPMAWDLGFMMPMLEMSGKRTVFIRDILYLYNRSNPLNDHKINFQLQNACAEHVRHIHPYTRLKHLPKAEFASKNLKADILIFSYDRPLQLYALLESIEKYMTGYKTISVLYRCSNDEFAFAYQTLSNTFSKVRWIKQSEKPHENFHDLCLKLAFSEDEGASDYLLFAVDDMLVKDYVDLTKCIQAIEKTGAYGFYLGYGVHLNYCYTLDREQTLPSYIPLKKTLYAWQFQEGTADWNYPNSLDMVLYSKALIKKDLLKISFSNPNTLESNWAKRAKNKRVGLFHPHSKVVNIPLNQVHFSDNKHLNTYSTKELLERFKSGLKMDIAPLFQINNSARHIDYAPQFIERDPS